MKATIEFSLPEENEEYRIYSSAYQIYGVLLDIDQKIRDWLKYDSHEGTKTEVLEEIRQIINEGFEF